MVLQDEIDKARAEIRTDGYPVSIGEWISLYEKDELDIHPEFQRFFRWTTRQKSRLIESILLGIPVPPVFVAQRTDGVWDVVDGLQRMSTIYEFIGILRDDKGKNTPALVLEGTKYLPSLNGKMWAHPTDERKSFTQAQKLQIKRAKIDVSIIQKESDASIKFELFQRLNTGGTQLSDQELRNSMMVMINPDFFHWIERLAGNEAFRECTDLSDKSLQERYDLELVLRFLVFRRTSPKRLVNLGDLGELLTDRASDLARDKTLNRAREEGAFKRTFSMLAAALSSDSFRRYDKPKDRFVGGFSVSAFEAVALGVGYAPDKAESDPKKLASLVARIWSDEKFLDYSGSGIRAASRVPRLVPYGRKLFSKV